MFVEKLKEKAGEIDGIIKKYTLNKQYPQILYESMYYSLFSDSKRIRPILLKETCKIVKGNTSFCEPLAAAVEMIHTYSLIHDDLPCMDDDELRRGKPTNHIVFGYPIALLGGDGLLNCAYETMINGFFIAENKENYMKACAVIAKAAGVQGMIGGQVADMINENTEPDQMSLNYIHMHKTGALLHACVMSGALCGNASETQLKALDIYGEKIGLMYQIVDDVLDVLGDEKMMGKKTGADLDHNKMTYPTVYGMDVSFKKINELYEESINALRIFENTTFLYDLAVYLKERKN